MRWLSLLLPHLALEVSTRTLPEDADARPAVVLREHRVVDLNAAAHAHGVRPGASRASARVVCPPLLCIEDDEECRVNVQAMLDRLAGWAHGYSSAVSLEPPDALLIEIEGSLRLFGGQTRLLQQISQDLREMDLSVRMGVAHTPMAALLLARAGQLLPPCSLPALRDRVLKAIDMVPVRCSPFSPQQCEQLEGMGIRTMGAVLRLPRQPLTRRFGPAMMLHLDRLTGRRDEPRRTVTPVPQFSSALHFLQDVTFTTGLLFPMRRQLEELAVWLRARQLATDTLVWQFRHPAHPPGRCLVRLARPEVSAAVFLELTRLKLDRSDPPVLPAAVASLSLTVRRLVPRAATEMNTRLALDRRASGGTDDDPTTLIDRIDARLGSGSCRRLLPQADHRPEHAQRCERASRSPVSSRSADRRSGAARGNGRRPRTRPTWLLQRPLPVTEQSDGLYWQGRLRLLQGPERIDAAWWASGHEAADHVSRDYYIAAPATLPSAPDTSSSPAVEGDAQPAARPSPRYWIYLDLHSGQWFLHGLFG